MSTSVTVVLNGYRRPEYLPKQYEAVMQQSVVPQEVLFWQNGHENFDAAVVAACTSAISNYNFGVWARFAFALNARTEYVCVIDDDTIPGQLWLENCLQHYSASSGVLGSRGLIFQSRCYFDYVTYGWCAPNDSITQVDIVGHNWFIARDLLGLIWREAPPADERLVGEDMQLSFSLQKYTGLGTFVPPHPAGNRELWGSIVGHQGCDNNALYLQPGMMDLMDRYFQRLLGKGWLLLQC